MLPEIPSIVVDNYQRLLNVVIHLNEAHECRRIAFLASLRGVCAITSRMCRTCLELSFHAEMHALRVTVLDLERN